MTEDKIKNSRPKKFSHRNTNNRYAFKFFFFFFFFFEIWQHITLVRCGRANRDLFHPNKKFLHDMVVYHA